MPVIENNPFFEFIDEIIEGVDEQSCRSLDGKSDPVRRFLVITSDRRLPALAVTLCPGLPLIGSPYVVPAAYTPVGVPIGAIAFDELAMCTHIGAAQKEKDDWSVWIVTCYYSRNIPSAQARAGSPQQSEQQHNDPTIEVPDVSWDFEEVDETREHDLFGSPFTNAAAQLLNPPPKFPRAYPVLNISRNERNFNFNKAQDFAFSLNNASFLTAPRGCVKCMPPKAVQKNRGFFFYWRTSYKLMFRALQIYGGYVLPIINVLIPHAETHTIRITYLDGTTGVGAGTEKIVYQAFPNCANYADSWQPLVINQGMYRLGRGAPLDMPSTQGLPVPIFRHGHHITHNVALDEKGQESKSPDPTTTPPEPIPVWYKQFITHRYKSFTELLVKGLS